MTQDMKQLTKQQILEQFVGKPNLHILTRLSLLGRQPKVVRTEEMELYLEWNGKSLRAITPMDLNWAEGSEDTLTEEGNIVVGNQLMQLFARDGQGAPLEQQARVEEKYVYQVGALYSSNRTVWPEAGEYNYRQGTHELSLFFGRLTSQDIDGIRRGPARFGLLVEQDIIFFLYEFGKACPLSDAPYTIHMITQNERVLPLPPSSLSPEQGVALNVVLVHSENGRIAALRQIGLGHEFSFALLEAIHRQAALPFSQPIYDRHLAEAYQKFPQTASMWRAAAHFEVPGRA